MLRHQYERWQSELEAQRRAKEELAERARREREAEERRQAELRKFAEDRDRCRQFRLVAACDAALQSPHATYQDRTDMSGWRQSGVKYSDDLAACRKHEVAACDAALAFPAVPEQTRALLLRWRAEAPLHQRAFAYARGAWDASLSWVRARTGPLANVSTPALIAGGIALTLAAILGIALAVKRRLPFPLPAPAGQWRREVAVVEAPRPGSVGAAGDAQYASAIQPARADPGVARTAPAHQSHSQHEPLGARSGVQTMKITGLGLYGSYYTARNVAGVISLIGWLLVVLGVVVAMGGLTAAADSARNPFAGMFGFWLIGGGVALVVAGLLQVAAGQMLRASVDSADYARQALLLQIGLAEGRFEIDLQRELAASQARAEADGRGPVPHPTRIN